MTAKRDRISEFLNAWRTEHPSEPFTLELERRSSDLVTELRSTPLREIRSWLAEFESKKIALENEFPHLKRVYSPFSDRYEDWAYSLCEASIPHLRLEIERRARRGGQPDKVVPPDNSDIAAQPQFTNSRDYRSVTLRGKTHRLTARQAQVIQILHEAQKSGNTDVSIAHILERLETQGSRWQDTFKSNPEAKKALIRVGERKGTLRLNL